MLENRRKKIIKNKLFTIFIAWYNLLFKTKLDTGGVLEAKADHEEDSIKGINDEDDLSKSEEQKENTN